MFAADCYPDGRVKGTVINAQQTGWFIWTMATCELREAVNISAMALSFEEDEFEHAGMKKSASLDSAVPSVAQSPCYFECRYLSTDTLKG